MKKLALTTLSILAATPALAHPGHDIQGLAAGLIHPLTGMDHLMAMVAVGLWSGLALPRRVWAGAAVFLCAMLLGAVLPRAGLALPMSETLVAASVLVLGALALGARRDQAGWMTGLSLAAIAGFALAHGYAHATEATGSVFGFTAGFLMATAALHLAGLALAARIAAHPVACGVVGSGIALSGLWMMAG